VKKIVKTEQQIIDEVVILRGKLMKMRKGNNFIGNDKIWEKSIKIKQKYSNFSDYYLFHILAGSTYERKDCSYFDFLGSDSILIILKELLKELV